MPPAKPRQRLASPLRAALCWLALTVAAAGVPTQVWAASATGMAAPGKKKKKKRRRKRRKKKKKKDRLTPKMAAKKREPIQQRAAELEQAGDFVGAGRELDAGAAAQGDPILFMDSADVYFKEAEKGRDLELVAASLERSSIALDILHFHTDAASDPDFRLVTDDEIPTLIARGLEQVQRTRGLQDEIEAEIEAAKAPPPKTRKKLGPGTPKIIGGGILTGLAVVAGSVGAAGLVIGARNQNRVEDPTVYGEEYDDFAASGRRGNIMAGVGLAIGAVALAGGITLFVLGRKERKNASDGPVEDDKVVTLLPSPIAGGGGAVITGRF